MVSILANVQTGSATHTVIKPANPPMPKVLTVPSFSPGAT